MKDETCGVFIKNFIGLKAKMCTSITEDNHESKKAEGINKNVVDDELKYEDCKNILFNRSYMKHAMNRIQSKDHNVGSHRINKISLCSYNNKNMYLKVNIVGYHIFINLLVNHIKNNFVEYREFVLIFSLIRTVILFLFFKRFKKYNNLVLFKNI